MKVLLAVHRWPERGGLAGASGTGPAPPVGGTERVARRCALALTAAGAEVVVFAGSLERAPLAEEASARDGAGGALVSRREDGPLTIVEVRRPDLHFDHWQKSRSVPVAECFVQVLRAERPSVLLVHHWIRLTRDLVFLAAREGIPAVVFLHDHWASCLRVFRVLPGAWSAGSRSEPTLPCAEPIGSGCISCAATLTPRTPWVSVENLHMAFAGHRSDLDRELSLARALVVPSVAHREALQAAGVALEDDGRWHVLSPPVPRASEGAGEQGGPPAPGPSKPLVLGCWGHLAPHKGTDLLLDALRITADRCDVELHLAGGADSPGYGAALRSSAEGLAVRFHGSYEAETLHAHPVTAVHALVCPTRAPESHGLILDEARALGLPAVLPRLGAFPERAREEPEGCDGVLFYTGGDAADLARVLGRLSEEDGLLARLCAGVRDAVAASGPGRTEEAWAGRILDLCTQAVAEGAPATRAPDWFDATMAREGERLWDEALSRTPPEELGS